MRRLSFACAVCFFALTFRGGPDACAEVAEVAEVKESVDVLFFGERGPAIVRMSMYRDGKPLTAAWEESRRTAFGFLDGDGDGQLSPKETRRYPWIMQLRQPTGGALTSLFSRLRGSAKPERPLVRSLTRELFDMQYLAMRPVLMVAPSAAGRRIENDLFDLADADDDKGLAAEELSLLAERANILDINSDGLISSRELWQYENPLSREEDFYNGQQPGAVERPEAAGWISLVDASQHPLLGLRLVEKYSRAGDSPSIELGELSPPSLIAADRDADGRVDSSEATAMLASPTPDVTIVLRVGERGGEAPFEASTGKGTGPESEQETGRESPVRIEVVHSQAVVFRLGDDRCELSVANLDGAGYEETYKQQFDAADADNNNYVDKKESMNNGYLSAAFVRMDRDADEKLYEEELLTYIGQESAAASSRLVLTYRSPGRTFFSLLDANADQKLSQKEVRAAAAALDRHDHNRDGRLESGELPKHHRLLINRAQPGELIVPFNAQDMLRNRDQRTPAGPRWHQFADRNRDGEVSWTEFRGRRELFNTLDKNGDAAIDLSEAQ